MRDTNSLNQKKMTGTTIEKYLHLQGGSKCRTVDCSCGDEGVNITNGLGRLAHPKRGPESATQHKNIRDIRSPVCGSSFAKSLTMVRNTWKENKRVHLSRQFLLANQEVALDVETLTLLSDQIYVAGS